MRRMVFLSSVAVLLCAWTLTARAQSNCVTCHQSFEDEEGPSYKIERDVHSQNGLDCHDCHGGDPSLDDMDEVRRVKGYKGVPSTADIPEFCASCHSNAAYMHEHNPQLPTDQLAKYKTSVHGQRLTRNNDMKVATCVSCHGVHDIGTADMPHSSTHPQNIHKTCGVCHSKADYMSGYGIATDQVDSYLESVHAAALLERGDLSAPTCNDCHGNHGAAPPGVTSLAAVCGNCHAIEAELFIASPHNAAFEAAEFPMCETCHSNHKIEDPGDKMVGDSDDAVCVQCHADDTGIEIARLISQALDSLKLAQDTAKKLLELADQKGMMVTDQLFLMKEVNQALIQARTLVHSFSADSVRARTDVGLAKAHEVKAGSASLVDEYYFRRKGLGLATLFITALVVSLFVLIRRIERRQKSS